MLRLRLGIVLIILSWFPFAQIVLYIAHNNGDLTSNKASTTFRMVVWGVQIIIGFIGLWLAGEIVMQNAKKDGWKKTPANVWNLFWGNKTAD